MNETPRGSGKYARARQWKRRWLAAVTCMAALVVFCTVYALVMPATALEEKTYCGMEEHTHDASCYESVLICGQEEGSGHVHDESCYEQELTCGKTEHTHTDECYVEPVSETSAAEETETGADTGSETGTETEAAAMPDGAQVPDGYTQQYTARDDANGFAVTVYAPEGAVPDGAALSAELLTEGDDAYAAAEEALAENTADTQSESEDQSEDSESTGSDYGFAAMDIHFEDADGNEVEPDGDVYVVIDAAGLLPEGADAESITVQHHVEKDNGDVTVETVADTADETEGVVVAQAEEDSENSGVQAAFEVNGFSTFTITWGNRWNSSTITVHYVDTNGLEIYSGQETDITVSSSTWIDLREYKVDIDGFGYQRISLNTYNGTQAKWLRYNNSGWFYSNSSSQPSNNGGYKLRSASDIYIVYRNNQNAQLTTAETVDSASQGVHMYMFNYNVQAFDGGGYATGDVKEGLASTTVNTTTGWPSLTGDSGTTANASFSTFFGNTISAYDLSELDSNISTNFDTGVDSNGANVYLRYSAQEVNHLFLKSYYDENGQYYFNSAEYFATLKNDTDKNFTVYNQLGTPSDEQNYFYQRGNFMPFNTLDLDSIRNYNLYDDTGAALDSSDSRVNEPLYGFNENNDFYFGMYTWADFYQPQNGLVENEDGSSDEMIFEFTGDDDMWVYIDGVLVLDLGGIHDAQSGSINFATGEVRWTDTQTGNEPYWNSSTLKTIFENAGQGNSTNWKGNTFADGSNHRIQIFYMERGAGASNLKISFNLKTIPYGQLAVTKEVENYYAPQLEDIEYTMQVMVDGKPYANQKYTFYEQSDSGMTDDNGCFTLKYGQTAVFPNLQAGDEVTVSEIASSDTDQGSTILSNYEIDYTVTDGAGNTIGSPGSDGTITATMPGYGSIRVTVTNTATYTRPLKLVKNFTGTENNAAPAGFEATYTLYEQTTDGNGATSWQSVGSIKYSDITDGEYVFWLDVDKIYKIEESFEDGDSTGDTNELKWSRVEITTNDPAAGTVANEGIVKLDTNDATLENASETNPVDTITLNNVYAHGTADLTIIKNIYGLTEDQVEGLINGEYSAEGNSGLRFDVDVFSNSEYLLNDEAGETDFPSGWDDWNDLGDWTFDVSDTLDSNGFVGNSWGSEVTAGSGDNSIATDETGNYTDISFTKETDDQGETYYRYEVTIKDVDLDQWYRVWELHVDVGGYNLTSSVQEYFSDNPSDDTLDNYLESDEANEKTDNRGNHDGRATAFQLSDDSTVEFTNRYTPNMITILKVDALNQETTLEGAQFQLYYRNEAGTPLYYKENSDGTTSWIDLTDESAGQPTTKESARDGKLTFTALPTDNIYYLVEIKAPDGYNLLQHEIKISWNEEGNLTAGYNTDGVTGSVIVDKDTSTITVTNSTGAVLPSTGGPGTTYVTIGGLLLMAAAVGGGYGLRRRRGREGR